MFENGGSLEAPAQAGANEEKKAESTIRIDNLIQGGAAESVVRHLGDFEGVSRKEVASKLIEAGKSHLVANNLKLFEGLDEKAAFALIASKQGEAVAGGIANFEGLDHGEVARRLRKAGRGDAVARNLNKFSGIDHQELADELIDAGKGDAVADNISKFEGLELSGIADRLIEAGAGSALAKNFSRFKGLDSKATAEKLIAAGEERALAQNLKNFKGLDEGVMSKLIDAGDAFYAVKYLDSFTGIDLDRTADELVDTKNCEYLLDNLDSFPGVDHDRIAKRLLDLPDLEAVSGNLAKFRGLGSEVALRLVKMGRAGRIAANMCSFSLDPAAFYAMVAGKCRNFMDKAEEEMPQLAEQARKNVVVLCSLLEGGNILELMKEMADENIFLYGALENNPRYGSKLFLKYYEFGKEARENVSTLYRFKQELLADKPDLDPQSAEFRQLMQGKLAGFNNNAAIKTEIEERTGNGSWFDYGESVRFALGEERVDFNEQVRLPIDRMSDFANNFKKTARGVLAQFEPELRNSHAIDAREVELADYITRLEGQLASAERDGDAGRAIGIRKGLAGARTKQEKAKPQSVWEKIRSDMRKLGLASSEMEILRGCCARDEEAIAKLADGKDRTRLTEAKAQLEKDKRALRERFGELVSSAEKSVNSLEATLARPLGPERAQALVQEINQQLTEDFSHFDADRSSLASVFEAEAGKDSLAGTDMSVRIASRDPDTDLYLGNYCPCCICIESGYHGSESPISDYVTDLGMQNVVVYDEKRQIPVVACWCFLGEDAEGSLKLTVDNIEANTDYSGRYPEQIGAAIKRFIEEYAKACGIDTKDIIQGPDNNDLEIFALGKVSRKLGGLYNKPEGYFLEALEDEDD